MTSVSQEMNVMGWSLDAAVPWTLIAVIACGLVSMAMELVGGRHRQAEHCHTEGNEIMGQQDQQRGSHLQGGPILPSRICPVEDPLYRKAMRIVDLLVFDLDHRWSNETFEDHERIGLKFAAYVLPDSNVMVGYVAYYIEPDKRVEIVRLAVLSAARRIGIGSALVQHAVTAGDYFDCTLAVCDVPERCLAAQLMLKSLGFRYTQTFRDEWQRAKGREIADTYRFEKSLDVPGRCGE